MSIITKETKDVTIGDTNYTITAFDATYGLGVFNQLAKIEIEGGMPPSDFIRNVILTGVTVNSVQKDKNWFEKHFAKNYNELWQLFNEIVAFNFGGSEEGDSPNADSDTND